MDPDGAAAVPLRHGCELTVHPVIDLNTVLTKARVKSTARRRHALTRCIQGTLA